MQSQSIALSLHPPCAHYYDDEGWREMPKVCTETYMKSDWSVTEMFKIM